jgi:cobalt/nickel transport system permease protein
LVRSYEQSEQIYRAMRLRGYSDRSSQRRLSLPQTGDHLALAATLTLAIGIAIAEFVRYYSLV